MSDMKHTVIHVAAKSTDRRRFHVTATKADGTADAMYGLSFSVAEGVMRRFLNEMRDNPTYEAVTLERMRTTAQVMPGPRPLITRDDSAIREVG